MLPVRTDQSISRRLYPRMSISAHDLVRSRDLTSAGMAGHLADYLAGEGRRLIVHNRTKAKAEELLKRPNVDWCACWSSTSLRRFLPAMAMLHTLFGRLPHAHRRPQTPWLPSTSIK